MRVDVQAELDAAIKRLDASWTPADRERAAMIAVDLQVLLARQLAGEDVDAELRQAEAAAAQMAAAGATNARAVLREMVGGMLTRAAVGVLTG